MRKLSKARSSNRNRHTLDTYRDDTRQRRIPGATITSWPGSADIDLAAFFARAASDTTITGAVNAEPFDRTAKGTVSLSDGTRITFAAVGPFDMAELA
jgi:hypothetical protein